MVRQTGAKIILLDRALANYGPETKEAREQLRSTVVAGIEMFPPGEMVKGSGFEGLESFERTNAMETLQTRIRELTPTTDIQLGPWSHAEAGLARFVLSVRTRLLPRPLWDQGPIDCPKVDGYHPVF